MSTLAFGGRVTSPPPTHPPRVAQGVTPPQRTAHRLRRRVVAGSALALGMLQVLAGGPARAQHPVVLQHGIRSSEATWDRMASAIANSRANVRVLRYSLSDGNPLPSQSGELQARLSGAGALSSSPAFVGHSQGGLISRYTTRAVAADALITVGSPHFGAPFAARRNYIRDEFIFGTLLTQNAYLSLLFLGASTYDYEYRYERGLGAVATILASINSVFPFVADRMIGRISGALNDLEPGSPFLNELNANAGAEQVPSSERISVLAQVEPSGYENMPFRAALAPGLAAGLSAFTLVSGFLAYEIGYSYLGTAVTGNGDWREYVVAIDMLAVGQYALGLPDRWNNYVAPDGGAHDGIVPSSNMRMPNTGQGFLLSAYNHVEETSAPEFTDYVSGYLVGRYGASEPPPYEPPPDPPPYDPPPPGCGFYVVCPEPMTASAGPTSEEDRPSWTPLPGLVAGSRSITHLSANRTSVPAPGGEGGGATPRARRP